MSSKAKSRQSDNKVSKKDKKNGQKKDKTQQKKIEHDKKKIVYDECIEAPPVHYNVPADVLTEILSKYGLTDHKTFSKIFTDLRQYENWSVLNLPNREANLETEQEHQTKPPFDEKIVKALFYIPSTKRSPKTGKLLPGKYQYLKLKLAPSSIKEAGIGVYAVDPIPKGARGVYRGISRDEEDVNMYYAWTVKSFDADTGNPDSDDETVYYVDAYELDDSNWTRYVNCGMRDKDNNFESDQKFDKFFYVAKKDIASGEECFIDYGEEYRTENLNMRGFY